MARGDSARLAILIDSDNAQPSIFKELLEEVSAYGTATVKRAYGDWTTPNLAGWKEQLNEHAVQPIQQFRYTTGKNSTDSALIIDAMDLLHGGQVDGFCLVSSDSDFTRLATRIRESGLAVYGFGKQTTPKPFVAACDKFIYTEILHRQAVAPATKPSHDKSLKPLLQQCISAVAQDDGWSQLSGIGSWLQKNDPAFDSRNFGYKKLSELVQDQPYLEVKSVPMGDGSPSNRVLVRLRKG